MTAMRRDRALAISFALAISLVPLHALADDEIDPNALRAEKLAADAETKANAGAHAEAVDLYLEAYKASPAGVLLFDIAVLYDQKLDASGPALDYYRRALASPDLEEPLALRARERITALEAKEQDKRRLVIGPPAARETRGWHPLAIGGVATAGVGLASLGTSAVLAIVAKSKDDEAASFCDGDRCTDARALELTNDAEGLANAATATFVIGAVLAAGGVILWLVAPSSKTSSPPQRAGGRF
jgi:hypothetical protein